MGKIDSIKLNWLNFWEPDFRFIVILRKINIQVYVQKISCLWGISLYSIRIITAFHFYKILILILALRHFNCLLHNSFDLSHIVLSMNHL